MKFLNSFFIGHILAYTLIFSAFVGLKIGYFNHYEIDEFFNVIFVNEINLFYIALPCCLLGYAVLYPFFRYFVRAFYLICLSLTILLWVSSYGKMLGETLFMKNDSDTTILYQSRDKIYIQDQSGVTTSIKR